MKNKLFHRRGAKASQRFDEFFQKNSLRNFTQALRLGGEILLVLIVLTFAACGGTEIKPVEIAVEDMCAHCKMAISEKQFVGEIINQDGDALKFDDIGCMLDYLKEKPETKVAAYFFVDYETKNWVEGDKTIFVKSDEITSPMSGGLIAFNDKTQAEATAAKFKGKILNLQELTKK
jgi:copper chaperone NosL